MQDFPRLETVHELDQPPTEREVGEALDSLKPGKSPGPDGIPGEVLRLGGDTVTKCMFNFITAVWSAGRVPQQWKDADIISIYKRKGDPTICGNSRGTSLLSTGDKVLARIVLLCLINNLADKILPESQCDFRKGRGTADMIFVVRQLKEKCLEQNRALYMVFVDLTKAFDTVNRSLLWEALRRFGCPPKFLTIIRDFHEGAMARIVSQGERSEPFDVNAGVRQGCVIAPVVFNLFIAGVFHCPRLGMNPQDSVGVNYRLDGSLFNLRRLQARTKISHDSIVDMQYADDAAVVLHSALGLQRNINVMHTAYERAGLEINMAKTEALRMGREVTDSILTVRNAAIRNVDRFTYLGSVVTIDGSVTSEVARRIGLAAASFGRLSDRVFRNRNLRTSTKVKVYKAVCLSILPYGSECWVHLKQLERFYFQCVQRILGLHWWDRVPHTEVRRRAQLDTIEAILVQRQLRWAVHLHRMDESRLPRRIYYGELAVGWRSVGRPRKRHKDVIASHMRRGGIDEGSLERLAENRDAWRSACGAAVERIGADCDRAAEERLRRRHQQRGQQPGQRFLCDICGRVCRSRIGLHSYQRTHK